MIENERPDDNRVVLLTARYWARRFGNDPNIAGKTLTLNGNKVTVIGVLPENFECLLFFGQQVDVVRPLAMSPDQRKERNNQWLENVVGRLKPGVSQAQAQAELQMLSERLAKGLPNFNHRFRVIPMAQVLGEGPKIFGILLALTGFILLIVCANLANLQMAVLISRSREIQLRAALGARRTRLARQLLTESLVLSFLGGALGLIFAVGCNQLLGHFLNIDRTDYHIAVPIDRAAVLFTVVVSFVTGAVVAAAPTLLLVRTDLNPALKENARSSGGRVRHRLQNTLITAEIAVAVPLLSCTGEMTVNMIGNSTRSPGWKPEGLMVGSLMLAGPNYDSSEKKKTFSRRLDERLRQLPNIESVTISSSLPIEHDNSGPITIEGQPRTDERAVACWHYVGLDYFKTLDIPLRQGRVFTPAEISDTSSAIIINQALADKLWPGQDLVGKHLAGYSHNEIIGIANDISDANGYHVYTPMQNLEYLKVTVRSTGSMEPLPAALRHCVAKIDPDLPLDQLRTATRFVNQARANQRTIVCLIGAFGGLGILLAAIGVYGVTCQIVSQRTGEFGIRMALGAQDGDVHWLVLRNGLKVSLAGALLGVGGSVAVLRILNSVITEFAGDNPTLFFGLPVTDWGIALCAASSLIAVALLASWIPTRRATLIPPMNSLRFE